MPNERDEFTTYLNLTVSEVRDGDQEELITKLINALDEAQALVFTGDVHKSYVSIEITR